MCFCWLSTILQTHCITTITSMERSQELCLLVFYIKWVSFLISKPCFHTKVFKFIEAYCFLHMSQSTHLYGTKVNRTFELKKTTSIFPKFGMFFPYHWYTQQGKVWSISQVKLPILYLLTYLNFFVFISISFYFVVLWGHWFYRFI